MRTRDADLGWSSARQSFPFVRCPASWERPTRVNPSHLRVYCSCDTANVAKLVRWLLYTYIHPDSGRRCYTLLPFPWHRSRVRDNDDTRILTHFRCRRSGRFATKTVKIQIMYLLSSLFSNRNYLRFFFLLFCIVTYKYFLRSRLFKTPSKYFSTKFIFASIHRARRRKRANVGSWHTHQPT